MRPRSARLPGYDDDPREILNVTQLIETGWDARFVQERVGHEHASTTSLYTSVSSDYRTRMLRTSLDRAMNAIDNLEDTP